MKLKLPVLQYRASMEPNSFNEETRTIDVTFTTTAPVERGYYEPFLETLSMNPEHVMLDRLNRGAPLLWNHNRYDQVGVVEKGWLEKDRGGSTVRFSDRPDDKLLEQRVHDVKTGIVTKVSIGYRVYKYEDITEKGAEMRHYLAVKWEPLEISFVSIPADNDAEARGINEIEFYPVDIIERSLPAMTEEEKKAAEKAAEKAAAEKAAAEKAAAEKAAAEKAILGERQRIKKIRELALVARLDEKFVNETYIEKGISVEDARKEIVEMWMKKNSEVPPTNTARGIEVTRDETVKMREGMENAMLVKANVRGEKISDDGKRYRGLHMVELAKEVLRWNEIEYSEWSKNKIALKAMSTGDFVLILENIATKTALKEFTRKSHTFEPIVNRTTAPDFKDVSRVRRGETPQYTEVPEHGRIQYGSIEEADVKLALATYAAGVLFTRKAIINDDLSLFMSMPKEFGKNAYDLESNLFWAQITTNLMADGVTPIFSAGHGNLAAGADIGGISNATMDKGFEAMGIQMGLDGVTELNLVPSFLAVPTRKQGDARRFTSSVVVPDQTANVNIYEGMSVIVEGRLQTHSVDAWYLFASAEDVDTVELMTLEGENGPTIVTETSSELQGVKTTGYYDLIAKVVEYRGMYKNPGA